MSIYLGDDLDHQAFEQRFIRKEVMRYTDDVMNWSS
jgi:hypothetical protein